ncbi:transposase [Kibdelosporangium philippinense]|uniref:Transposase n=1 Tax=Kibdelosporangium philippinense TaxID=211113 RepID=A0ABS8ZVF3_9PSEU|nr:transposase [Kibdelosporangium philippinense]MCE7009822.1 transposase [Kibdelosporangium philippinense]
MPRYRLSPTPEQEVGLLKHCTQARLVWNLAVEQHSHWRPGMGSAPGYVEQARQLTEARAEFPWLRAGSVTVQQQALRDFAQAMRNFFASTHRKPTWRKAGRDEGFRQVALKPQHIQRLNRRCGQVWVPEVGWIRFRWSRRVTPGVKSYRVTQDRVGRWHIAFAAIPDPIPAPGNSQVVGVDRGVVVSAALSTGDILKVPGLTGGERRRLEQLHHRLARCQRGSHRRRRVRRAITRLTARETDRRKDWVEKSSTELARRFDVIRVEDLNIRGMARSAKGTIERPGRNVRQKAGLNRGILANGWGLLITRLEHKAAGRVERVKAAFTSQQCSACSHIASENRKSQAVFQCIVCRFTCHADVNAARNIAAGRAVTAQGALQPLGGAVNCEPQLAPVAF